MSRLCGSCTEDEHQSEILEDTAGSSIIQLPIQTDNEVKDQANQHSNDDGNAAAKPGAVAAMCSCCEYVEEQGKLKLQESLRLVLESPEFKASPRAGMHKVFFEDSTSMWSQTVTRSLASRSQGLAGIVLLSGLQQQQKESSGKTKEEASTAPKVNGCLIKGDTDNAPKQKGDIAVPVASPPPSDRQAPSSRPALFKKSKMRLFVAVAGVAVLIAAAIVLGLMLPYSFSHTSPIVPVGIEGAVVAAKRTFYAPGGYILDGRDPVAYRKLERNAEPVMGRKGDSTLESDYKGLFKVAFASKEHKEMFDTNPRAYLPKYGAWCACVIAHGEYRPADPTMWEVHEGELYVAHGQRELEVWRADRSGFITEGNRFWAAQGWAN
ncbi:unnamed protein product [Vitrella brassicaformis CCMP3155]|uniref:YHS domain-containing protein n=2 Tax=Vitrella brassicaformis TaxID=1169539 RepID=A0A0G4GNP3_VITBC|nr:unnamed protein product [Vitrella brassicaformis CCMP3155]|eukprot:CEM31906.1 unnamed protein product [Vitrella brassicaformis CCMP3155]